MVGSGVVGVVVGRAEGTFVGLDVVGNDVGNDVIGDADGLFVGDDVGAAVQFANVPR